MGDFVHESGSVACFIGNLRMPLEFTSGTQTEIEMPRVPNKKNKPNHPSHEKVGFGGTAVSFHRQGFRGATNDVEGHLPVACSRSVHPDPTLNGQTGSVAHHHDPPSTVLQSQALDPPGCGDLLRLRKESHHTPSLQASKEQYCHLDPAMTDR